MTKKIIQLAVMFCLLVTAGYATDIKIKILNVETDKGQYQHGQAVHLTFTLSGEKPTGVRLKRVAAYLQNLETGQRVPGDFTIAGNITIGARKGYVVKNKRIWTIPADTQAGPYAVMLTCAFFDGTSQTDYGTFFRAGDRALTCFDMAVESYQGLKVFKLDGGMSAEYAVEKAAEGLAAGISHSWEVNGRGSGPNQVYATPQFLVRSVQRTVDFYDDNFGDETVFPTVIIGTGMPSVPYLSWATHAPYLPLHFLVSASTTRELQTIHEYASKRGYKTYSTLGYDPSVPKDAVAWVKLLDLPAPYLAFLKRHKVRNLIILGATGQTGGETMARLLTRRAQTDKHYLPGDLYLLYPQSGSADDEAAFTEKLKDYAGVNRDKPLLRIADWESGIIPEQVSAFSASAKKNTLVKNVQFITGVDDGDLYKLATYVSAAFTQKNQQLFTKPQQGFNGVILNPYLISNPFCESISGYLPYVYWQGNPAGNNVAGMEATVNAALAAYFPGQHMDKMEVWLNSSQNFGAAERALVIADLLKKSGFTRIRNNDYQVDEVWNMADGMNAPCELKARELFKQSSAVQLKSQAAGFTALTPADLETLSKKFPSIIIKTIQ